MSPILKPKHFEGLQAAMNNGGLSFKARLGVEDWIEHSPLFGTSDEDDQRLRGVAARRGLARVVLNPINMPISEIKQVCELVHAALRKHEGINTSYLLPNHYCRKWTVNSGDHSEGQKVVLANFDKRGNFVGYAGMSIALHSPWVPGDSFTLSISIHLVYVLPTRRGSGYGLDLSIASGLLAADVLNACYLAVPSGSVIEPLVQADYENKSGETFTLQVMRELHYGADMLKTHRRRPSVKIVAPSLSAGY